jgi:Transposase DDE domain
VNCLARMAQGAKQELAVEQLQVCADRGYYNTAQIKECEEAKIEVYMERPRPKQTEGIYPRELFRYDEGQDIYECPAGKRLTFRVLDKAKQMRCYWTEACHSCPLKSQCTSGKGPRKIKRPVAQAAAERMFQRVAQKPELLAVRKELVEHLFGSIKRWMNQDHFLMRGQEKVTAESSLTFLAYNLKRAISVLGVEKLRAGLVASQAKRLLPAT